MKVGYSRTSTVEQVAGFEAQIRDLEAQGCERIFKEQVSSVAERPELAAAIDFIRDGDELIVTRIDRLARSVADLVEIIKRVHAKGAHLRIGNLGSTDPGEPTGALIVNVLGSIAQFERQIMLQRQREGIAKAKAEGRYRGRKPTARAKADDARRLAAEGISKVEIARRLGIHRASVYRALEAKPSGNPA